MYHLKDKMYCGRFDNFDKFSKYYEGHWKVSFRWNFVLMHFLKVILSILKILGYGKCLKTCTTNKKQMYESR